MPKDVASLYTLTKKLVFGIAAILFISFHLAVLEFVATNYSMKTVFEELPGWIIWPMNLLYLLCDGLILVRAFMVARGSKDMIWGRVVWLALLATYLLLSFVWQFRDYDPKFDPVLNLPHKAWAVSIACLLILLSAERPIRSAPEFGTPRVS